MEGHLEASLGRDLTGLGERVLGLPLEPAP
jgi:hypothetical protein